MHEYEFRLVVESPFPFLPLLQSLGLPVRRQTVYYAKPHFRFRDRRFETKRILSSQAVYHDTVWFRWIHSLETPFRHWSRATLVLFLHNVGNFQDPFTAEVRSIVDLDSRAQLYTFRVAATRCHRLVFEFEYGTFRQPLASCDPVALLDALNRYRHVYLLLKAYPLPPFQANEPLSRRSVACIETVPEGGDRYLYAHKLDGTFGLVYSYRDRVKEKWEGYECVVRRGVSLGDGLVFAAEKMQSEAGYDVYLLDVYQMRGHETAPWNRRVILTEFLPRLEIFETTGEGRRGGRYRVQTYVSDRNALRTDPPFKTDGLIVHDVVQDLIYKFKTKHSIDLVYHGGYFHLPKGRIECSERGLDEGSVYEISTEDGRVLRKRTDRFKGNTSAQLESILKNGWHGPPILPLADGMKSKNQKKKNTIM